MAVGFPITCCLQDNPPFLTFFSLKSCLNICQWCSYGSSIYMVKLIWPIFQKMAGAEIICIEIILT
jgi:hypothetical protein